MLDDVSVHIVLGKCAPITHLHHLPGLLLFMKTCSVLCSHASLVQALSEQKAFIKNKPFIIFIICHTIIEFPSQTYIFQCEMREGGTLS